MSFSDVINSYIGIFDRNRKLLPFSKTKQRKFREKKIVDSWIQESWKHVMSLTIVWHSGQNFHKTIWSSSSGLVMLSFRSCMISVMLVLPERVIHVECAFIWRDFWNNFKNWSNCSRCLTQTCFSLTSFLKVCQITLLRSGSE